MKTKKPRQEDTIRVVRHVEHLILNGLSLKESLAKLETAQVSSPEQRQLVRSLLENKPDKSTTDTLNSVKGLREISSLIRILYQHKCSPEHAVPALSYSLSIDQNYMRQVWSGLQGLISYATSIFVVVSVCLSIFSTKVIPNFEDMFSDFGEQLPALTIFVMQGAEMIGDSWHWIILIGIICYFGLKTRKSNRGGLKPIPKLWALIPLTRNLYKTHFRYLLITYSHILIKGGLDSKFALQSALKLLHPKEIDSCALAQLPELMHKTSELSSLSDAYQIDTVSREVEFQLNRIEQDYLAVIAKLRERLSSLMQLLLGIIVGGIIIAMYLPIFSMGSTI